MTRREALELAVRDAKEGGDGRPMSVTLARARRARSQARELARNVRTLTGWLGHDVLNMAWPELEERRQMFAFIVEQLRLRQPLAHRIRPVRLALQRQRDAVLGFVQVLNDKLVAIALRRNTPQLWVRQVCRLYCKKPTSASHWRR